MGILTLSSSNKFLIKFIAFFSIFSSYAQISGEIEYGTEFIKIYADTSKISSEVQKDIIVSRENNAKMILADDQSYFKVKFNSHGAVTKNIKIMTRDGGLNPHDYTFVSDKYYYIGNVPYEDLSFFINDKNNYFVKSEGKFSDWEILEEKKRILGYTCQKAIVYFLNKKGEKKTDRPIIAWFTEEIPASYGPYRYHGLPGFILEVHELGRRHYARKITLNKKVKIDFPKEKELYTKEEFRNRRK